MFEVFIVEDDAKMRGELCRLLEKYGYKCSAAQDFEDIPQQILASGAHIVLLDINLPYYDGYHVCREVRKTSEIPIIMVTSRDTEADELISMNLGADDFITKPYNTGILLARISAVLSRVYKESPQSVEYGGLALDMARSVAKYGESEAELTKNELKLLAFLMQKKTQIVSRNDLIDCLWQTDSFIDDNTLSVNMNRLRRKLEEMGLCGYIKTKRGQGYSL